jgi:hypothetical protein
MIYIALLFLIAFSGFFLWEAQRSLKAGVVRSGGSTWTRQEQPVRFWIGIAAWLFNAAVGAAFLLALLNSSGFLSHA